jgi:hypothetical protein
MTSTLERLIIDYSILIILPWSSLVYIIISGRVVTPKTSTVNKRHKIDSKFSTSYVGTRRKHSDPMRLFSLRREGGLHGTYPI